MAQMYAREQAEQNSENLRSESDDEDDDGERQRKRLRKEGSEEAGLYQVHPLRVVLHVYDNEIPDPKSHEFVILKFEYLLKLNVVCVGIEESQAEPENNIFWT